ncbi:MAG: Lipoprotein-releasing system ATP-binding protein LolD [Phycisphaerae bacterium]|nr:Lipoprotein-releasing system ATP-binding protein LolD [Phycisphaerae bacterium]
MSEMILQAERVTRSFDLGAGSKLEVLRGVSLQVRQGELLAITGPSGCGKSTLLHILGLLDLPNSGQVIYQGQRVLDLSSHQRDQLRCRSFGFVFQLYHLLPELNVLDNVLFPQMILFHSSSWWSQRGPARRRALDVLERVGLQQRLRHRPNQLSGGERQRVAIARALMNQPAVLLADEPTGNLDKQTGQEVLRLLHELHRSGQTLLLVTHDAEVAQSADRVLRLEEGQLIPAV